MTIPSPRTFIEIAAFFVFALCVMLGMTIAVLLLAMIWGAEKVVDQVQGLRIRRARR